MEATICHDLKRKMQWFHFFYAVKFPLSIKPANKTVEHDVRKLQEAKSPTKLQPVQAGPSIFPLEGVLAGERFPPTRTKKKLFPRLLQAVLHAILIGLST
jgi:hypothetical protein